MPKKKIIATKSKLPRMPNKIKGIDGVPSKEWTPDQITAILDYGSEYFAPLAAQLTELGHDAERLIYVHRLKVRGMSIAQIANVLGFSPASIEKDIAVINKQLRAEVHNFDYPLFIGQSMRFFEEVRNISMGIADSNASDITKLGAIKTALAAETDKAAFLERVGAFANLPNHFVAIPDSLDDQEETDGQQFQKFMKAFIAEWESKKTENETA